MSRLDLQFSPETRKAIDWAKRAVSEGGELDAALLLASIYHTTELKTRLPDLGSYLKKPPAQRKKPLKNVPVTVDLQPILRGLLEDADSISPDELFLALLDSAPGRQALLGAGLGEEAMQSARSALGAELPATASAPAASAETGWRSTSERQEAVKGLSSFGRMLTDGEPPYKGVVEMDEPLKRLTKVLIKMKRRNAIVHGPPGTGKSALIYELARRLVAGDPSIPKRLRDLDIFELSPTFLRSGASMVGQYDERVKALIKVLSAHPKIILFIDEIHSIFQSGMHHHGPFTEANEGFKAAMGRGEITCIGCTTTAEYRHYIAPDGALARRFSTVKLEAPSRQGTLRILEARLPRLEAHYAPLRVLPEMLERTVDLTEEYLLDRYQPDKSIQLLDEACALCTMRDPQPEELSEEILVEALEDSVGHSVVKAGELTEAGVLETLSAKIVGQDETLQAVTRAFVAGLGEWRKSKRPRGCFFFCGPTGVGKTETAVLLSKILGGGREAMVRVDCNTLQGGGRDSGPIINRLLGPPPGYIGYVRGQGGILSKIREVPESIVLFDEIEKADPGLGKTLLQILDKGRIDDSDGNPLDFRRSFIIFTTNAGCVYDRSKSLGFGQEEEAEVVTPRADVEAVKEEIRRVGHGEEFLGRVSHFFIFNGLEGEAIQVIVGQRLEALREAAEVRGYELEWDPEIVQYLTARWQPRFGVRHLTTILRHRISEQLAVAEAQGELRGVEKILLRVLDLGSAADGKDVAGVATRERERDSLIINLA